MLLAIVDIYCTRCIPHTVPMGMMLLCRGWLSSSLGILPKQARLGCVCAECGWGCNEPLISSHDEITMLISALPPLPSPPCRIDLIVKAVMLTSSVNKMLCLLVGPWQCLPLCVGVLSGGGCCWSTAETHNPHCLYLSGMLFKTNEAQRLLPLPLLSVSFSLPSNLSFSLTLMPK